MKVYNPNNTGRRTLLEAPPGPVVLREGVRNADRMADIFNQTL